MHKVMFLLVVERNLKFTISSLTQIKRSTFRWTKYRWSMIVRYLTFYHSLGPGWLNGLGSWIT